MRIKKSVSKHSISYSVIENVRDINGKSTTRVVEALGNEQEIRDKHPGIEPEEWARQYAKKLTNEKKSQQKLSIIKFNTEKLIESDEQRTFNVGYLFLQSLYYQLGLSKITQDIQSKYKFEYDLNEVLSKLIYMRILHPNSKRSSFEQAKQLLEGIHGEPHHMYRALDILKKESDAIQSAVYRNSQKIVTRHEKILYYDCTNFYFEMEQEGGLKQCGVSKEHHPNPIVQMGLFMDGSGLPLAFSTFPRNENEQTSLNPLEKKILKDFELSEIVVCTDAGLSSKNNRLYNTLGSRGFITTQSIKKLKKHLKAWALDPSGWRTTTSSQPIHLGEIEDMPNNTETYYKERWIKENDLEQRLLVTFSPKYKSYQETIRKRQIECALKKVDKPSTLKKKCANDPLRFIKVSHATTDGDIAEKGQITLDGSVIDKEAQYDGFYGICTNLTSDPSELIRVNHQRWEIEERFRIMKTELKSRPVYVRNDDRIEAHFLTCFLSLLIYRLLEQKLDHKFSCQKTIKTLKEMNVMRTSGDGYIPLYERTHLTDQLHEIFGFRTDFEINTIKHMKNILKLSKKAK